MASVVTLLLVDACRSERFVVTATLCWTVRSLGRVRRAAKHRQRVTSKLVAIPHRSGGDGGPADTDSVPTDPISSSHWRCILIPKGSLCVRSDKEEEEEAEEVYSPEIVIECTQPSPNEAEGSLAPIEGFRASCMLAMEVAEPVIDGTATTTEDRGDSSYAVRLCDLLDGKQFEQLGDTLSITVKLDIFERGYRANRLMGSIVASVASHIGRVVAATEPRAGSTAVAADGRRDAEPSAPASTAEEEGHDTQRASAWNHWFGVLAMNGAPFPESWVGEEFAWCELCSVLAVAVAQEKPHSRATDRRLPHIVSTMRGALLACITPEQAASIDDIALPSDGDINEALLEPLFGSATEAFPVLKRVGGSAATWLRYLYTLRVAAAAGPDNIEPFLRHLAQIADGFDTSVVNGALSKVVIVMAPAHRRRTATGAAMQPHTPSDNVIDNQLDRLATLRELVLPRRWGDADQLGGELLVQLDGITSDVQTWKGIVRKTEDLLVAAQQRRAQIAALPPYRSSLAPLRHGADEQDAKAAGLDLLKAAVTHLTSVESLARVAVSTLDPC